MSRPRVFAAPNHGAPRAAAGHMPFPGHRTCAEWGHKREHKQAPLSASPDSAPCPLCGVRSACKHRLAA